MLAWSSQNAKTLADAMMMMREGKQFKGKQPSRGGTRTKWLAGGGGTIKVDACGVVMGVRWVGEVGVGGAERVVCFVFRVAWCSSSTCSFLQPRPPKHLALTILRTAFSHARRRTVGWLCLGGGDRLMRQPISFKLSQGTNLFGFKQRDERVAVAVALPRCLLALSAFIRAPLHT